MKGVSHCCQISTKIGRYGHAALHPAVGNLVNYMRTDKTSRCGGMQQVAVASRCCPLVTLHDLAALTSTVPEDITKTSSKLMQESVVLWQAGTHPVLNRIVS